jgi:hypothetical protein
MYPHSHKSTANAAEIKAAQGALTDLQSKNTPERRQTDVFGRV